MRENKRRILPKGIQSFKKIREEGYLYVDKTDLVWNLVNGDNQESYCYLSRPRRFGKSVLLNTLQCYLEGRKELFEGLKIMELEHEWAAYPIIRLDMSGAGSTAETLHDYLDASFSEYERKYGIGTTHKSLPVRLSRIIKTAAEKTGKKAAVLIDEYDYPLLHSWKTPEHDPCTNIYKDVFTILKSMDEHEKLVFITGVAKFTQISLFSALNNLTNISFLPQYATLCGITEQEIKDCFMPEIESMGKANGWTVEETHDKLREYYDGYHFCHRNMVNVYNPFSLICALSSQELSNYWASSGATTLIPKFLEDMELRLKDFEHCPIMRTTLEMADVMDGGAELFLYQSGYLTIKQRDEDICYLGFPNMEVRQALYDAVVPSLTMRKESDAQSLQAQLKVYLLNAKLAEAIKTLKALIADVPYSNIKLKSMNMEERYRLVISSILYAIGFHVQVERMIATGRIDIVCTTSRYIYIIELKLTNNGGLKAAKEQITKNAYKEPFMAGKQKVIGLAIELQDDGKGLVGWELA